MPHPYLSAEAVVTRNGSMDMALHGRWLVLIRIIWIAVAALALTAFVLGIVPRYQELLREFEQNAPGFTPFHLSATFLAAYRLTMEIVFILAFVIPALLIFWHKSNERMAIFTSLTLLTFGVSVAFTPGTIAKVFPVWKWPLEFVQMITTTACLILFFIFPNGRFVPRWTRMLAIVWACLNLIWLFWPNAPLNHLNGTAWRKTIGYSLVFSLSWFGIGFYAQLYRYRWFATSVERQQTKWVLYGFLFSIIGAFLRYVHNLFPQVFVQATPHRLFIELLSIPLSGSLVSLVPICIGMSILRYRLWDIDIVINRTLLYGALTMAVAGIYASSVLVFQQLLRALTGQESTIAVVMATLLSAVLFRPLRHHLQSLIDRRFYRNQVDFQQAFTEFAHEIRTITTLPDLFRMLLARTIDLLHSAHGAIFLQGTDGHLALADVQNLSRDDANNLQLSDDMLDQLRVGIGVARSSASHFVLLLPLLGLQSGARENLIGVLALGPRLSGQGYSKLDYDVLMSLAQQAGLAISAAQLIAFGRELEASPTGQAESQARVILRQPHSALRTLHRLAEMADRDPDAARLLGTMPEALHHLGNEQMAKIVTGFAYLVTSQSAPEMLSVGLRTLVHHLAQMSADEWPEATEACAVYAVCQGALEVSSIAAITRLHARFDDPVRVMASPRQNTSKVVETPTTDTPTRVPHHDPTHAHVDLHFLADLAAPLVALRPVVIALQAYERVDSAHDQLSYLIQAVEHLRQIIQHRVPQLVAPDRVIVQGISEHWTTLITDTLRVLQGRAILETTLFTRQVIAAEQVTLGVEVRNVGRGPATNIVVTLLPCAEYLPLDHHATIDALQPHWSIPIHFTLHPLTQSILQPCLEVRFDDGEQAGKTELVSTVVQLLPVAAAFTPIPNPYTPGMPLRLNSPVFVGREDMFTFIREALNGGDRGNALVLTGQRRMGKTSLLQQLPLRLSDCYIPIYLDGQSLAIDPGMPNFFYDVALEIADALSLPLPPRDAFLTRPSAVFEREFLPQALAAAGDRRLLFLFDEFEELEVRVRSGKLDSDIFAYLRHLMQHKEHLAFIFVGTQKLEALHSDHWASFFNVALYRRITFLERDTAQALITTPVTPSLVYDDLALDKMLRMTAGHPYFLQVLCHTVVHAANQRQRNYIVLDDVNQALHQVLELGAAHFEDLWQQSTVAERLVLLVLTEILASTSYVTSGEVGRYLAAHDIDVAQQTLNEALECLVGRDILAHNRDGTNATQGAYCWQLHILGLWVAKYRAWSQVIADFQQTIPHPSQTG